MTYLLKNDGARVMKLKNDEDTCKQLLEKWDELRVLVESMDLDIRKNAVKNNQSAGLRARRGLRLLKKLAHEILMSSVDEDKRRSKERRESRDET
jgi:hypothetical protein